MNRELEEKRSDGEYPDPSFPVVSVYPIPCIEAIPIHGTVAKECLPEALELPHHPEWEPPVAVHDHSERNIPRASSWNPTTPEVPAEEQGATVENGATISLAQFSDPSLKEMHRGEWKETEPHRMLDGVAANTLQESACTGPEGTGKLSLTVTEGCTSCPSCINIKIQLVRATPPLSLLETTPQQPHHHHHHHHQRAKENDFPSRSGRARTSPSLVDRTSLPTTAEDSNRIAAVHRSPPTMVLLSTGTKESNGASLERDIRGIGQDEAPDTKTAGHPTVAALSSSASVAALAPHPLAASSGSSMSFSLPLLLTPKVERRPWGASLLSESATVLPKRPDGALDSVEHQHLLHRSEGTKVDEEEEVDTISCFTGFPTPVRISPLPLHRDPTHALPPFCIAHSGWTVSRDPTLRHAPLPGARDWEAEGIGEEDAAKGGRVNDVAREETCRTATSVSPPPHQRREEAVPPGARTTLTHTSGGGFPEGCPHPREDAIAPLLPFSSGGEMPAMTEEARRTPAPDDHMWYTLRDVQEMDLTASPLSSSAGSMANEKEAKNKQKEGKKKKHALRCHASSRMGPPFSSRSSTSSSASTSVSSASSLFADAEALSTTLTHDAGHTTPVPSVAQHPPHHHHCHPHSHHRASSFASSCTGSALTGVEAHPDEMVSITRFSALAVVQKAQHPTLAGKPLHTIRDGLLVYALPREGDHHHHTGTPRLLPGVSPPAETIHRGRVEGHEDLHSSSSSSFSRLSSPSRCPSFLPRWGDHGPIWPHETMTRQRVGGTSPLYPTGGDVRDGPKKGVGNTVDDKGPFPLPPPPLGRGRAALPASSALVQDAVGMGERWTVAPPPAWTKEERRGAGKAERKEGGRPLAPFPDVQIGFPQDGPVRIRVSGERSLPASDRSASRSSPQERKGGEVTYRFLDMGERPPARDRGGTPRHDRPLVFPPSSSSGALAPPVFPLSEGLRDSWMRENASEERAWRRPPSGEAKDRRRPTGGSERREGEIVPDGPPPLFHWSSEGQSGPTDGRTAVALASRASPLFDTHASLATPKKKGHEREGEVGMPTAASMALPYRPVHPAPSASPSPSPVNPYFVSLSRPCDVVSRSSPLMSPSPDSDEWEEEPTELHFSSGGRRRMRETEEKVRATCTALHATAVAALPLRLSHYGHDGDPAGSSSSSRFAPTKSNAPHHHSRTPLQSFLA